MSGPAGRSDWEGRPIAHWRDAWGIPWLEIHDVLPSTNDRVRELDGQGAPRFSTVIAEEQTAGRGRGGRNWTSPAGMGLWVSVLTTSAGSAGAPLTPILAGLAAVRAIARVAPELDPGLKWPNDVMVRGRKVCGILCEAAGRRRGVVAGIGVNVRQAEGEFSDELAGRAISVEGALGTAVSRPELARALLTNVMELMPTSALSGALLAELEAADALRGRTVRVSSGPEGTARGIAADGALLIEDGHGHVHEVRGGSVRLVSPGTSENHGGPERGA